MSEDVNLYLDRLQHIAVQLKYVLSAINAVIEVPERADLAAHMIFAAAGMAKDLDFGLDCINRPKGGAA